MRSASSIIITIVAAVILGALYIFVAKAQISSATNKLIKGNEQLQTQLTEIRADQADMPVLAAKLPFWRKQLELFKKAIPVQIEDDKFLQAIAQELKRTGVTLVGIEAVKGGAWLGNIKEDQVKQLEAMKLDVNAARQIQVAFYSVTLLGDFDKVISAFEYLKQHQRLYSIDQVSGPAPGDTGQILENIDPNNTPIQITGKIYSGIPADYLSVEQLNRVYTQVVAAPVTRRIKAGITSTARTLATTPNGVHIGGGKPPAADGQPRQGGRAMNSEKGKQVQQAVILIILLVILGGAIFTVWRMNNPPPKNAAKPATAGRVEKPGAKPPAANGASEGSELRRPAPRPRNRPPPTAARERWPWR